MIGPNTQPAVAPDLARARSFLMSFYIGAPGGYLTIFPTPSRKTEFFAANAASELDRAALRACALAASNDDYSPDETSGGSVINWLGHPPSIVVNSRLSAAR